LIEVMGSAAILIVGLSGLTQALSSLRTAGDRAEALAVRAQIARGWLDRALRAPVGAAAFATRCTAGEAECTSSATGATRTRSVDATGEPDSRGGFVVTWSLSEDGPRAGVRGLRISVGDALGESTPLVLDSHVR
jgi:hypothetical protein